MADKWCDAACDVAAFDRLWKVGAPNKPLWLGIVSGGSWRSEAGI